MATFSSNSEEPVENEDDYQIVSFEEFCDKSPGSKPDLLTLNDNINYRLCYENASASKCYENTPGTSSSKYLEQTETSLSGPSSVKHPMPTKESSFTPFRKYNGKTNKGVLLTGTLLKPKSDYGPNSSQHRYHRFSAHRSIRQSICDHIPGIGSGILIVAIICALCVGVWWAVCGTLGGAWGEEHYRKLWERTHPENLRQPIVPVSYEKILPENRYHDHNNLNTRNKNNTEVSKNKPEMNKKNIYTERPPEVMSDVCAQTSDNMRFDCFPQAGANEAGCTDRGCCWRGDVGPGVPYCFYPPQYDSFRFINMTENKHGMTVYYEKQRPSGYPHDFEVARLEFKYLSNDVLLIKICDAEKMRFETPYPEIPIVSGPITELKYRVQIDSSSVGFKIIRNIDNITVVNTENVGGLILSDKFLQISSILPTGHVYGLGEKRARLLNDINWNTFTLFNEDLPPIEHMSGYGTHPFYLAVEHDGNSHGMVLLNSNAMDIVLQPTPAITYRTVGGVLNLVVMMGPTPKNVVAQYTEMVGRPFMPPYWSLGFHLCKFNYGSLNVTRDVWQKNRNAGIPFDVQWNDLDYMNNSNDFTYDSIKFAGLPAFVKELHREGMHYVVLIDAGVSAAEKPGEYPPYDLGHELGVFIKNSTNEPFVGKVWNKGSTVFPDFTHPDSSAYWLEMMSDLHNLVQYDGAWIDMNEPSNFVSGQLIGECAPEELPYKPRTIDPEGLRHKTLCMDAQHYAGQHYDWHNLHSLTEAIATHYALKEIRGTRPFIISRSSFVGIGHYAGHWSGDNLSDWHDMSASIPELLSFSLFGVPMMGSDICGFRDNTSVELCKRWMQLGAFYPFSRNHNSDTSRPQDPVSLGEEVVSASRRALRLRYRLLPYYYTLFWRAHVYGETVARPLFFEMPSATELHDIDDQFLIGANVMVTPILDQGTSSATPYFPGPERWYNIVDGVFIQMNGRHLVDENQTVSVRGGGIIPLQEPPVNGPVTTTVSRRMPFQLLVVPNTKGSANGELYWDDGDSLNSYQEKKFSHIEFILQHTLVQSTVHWWGYGVPPISNITVLEQPSQIKMVTINNLPCKKPLCEFTYLPKTKVLQVFNINLRLDKPFSVEWTYKGSQVLKQPVGRLNSVQAAGNDTISF